MAGNRRCPSGLPPIKPSRPEWLGEKALRRTSQRNSDHHGWVSGFEILHTETALKGLGDFQPAESGGPGTQGAVGGPWSYAGRNVAFGVREHAMGAAVNGMAAHGGVLPFSATFLIFSDYMETRHSTIGALSKLKAIYVFTHDSIGVGEDGPTHEPIEQLAGLRSVPGLTVIRPADPNETSEAWAFAMEHEGPTLLALTRQSVPTPGSEPC